MPVRASAPGRHLGYFPRQRSHTYIFVSQKIIRDIGKGQTAVDIICIYVVACKYPLKRYIFCALDSWMSRSEAGHDSGHEAKEGAAALPLALCRTVLYHTLHVYLPSGKIHNFHSYVPFVTEIDITTDIHNIKRS